MLHSVLRIMNIMTNDCCGAGKHAFSALCFDQEGLARGQAGKGVAVRLYISLPLFFPRLISDAVDRC